MLRGQRPAWHQLFGGLAHVTYPVATDAGARYVVKFLTQEMDDFGLMIPIDDLIANTVAAGESGVGARVVQALPDVPAIVLEYIDGRHPRHARPGPAGLHPADRPGHPGPAHPGPGDAATPSVIWKFLDDYLDLIARHSLDCPDGILDWLPTVRRIQTALDVNAAAPVPSNNDLLAKNVMDDGRIRIIDYDFSGMNDPMFDVGDLAMEGDYDPDQIAGGLHRVLRQARPRAVRQGQPVRHRGSVHLVAAVRRDGRAAHRLPRLKASTTGRRPRRAGTGRGPSSRIRRSNR